MVEEATTEPEYIAGWDARKEGLDIDACPYSFPETIQWVLWRGGWNDRDMIQTSDKKAP